MFTLFLIWKMFCNILSSILMLQQELLTAEDFCGFCLSHLKSSTTFSDNEGLSGDFPFPNVSLWRCFMKYEIMVFGQIFLLTSAYRINILFIYGCPIAITRQKWKCVVQQNKSFSRSSLFCCFALGSIRMIVIRTT